MSYKLIITEQAQKDFETHRKSGNKRLLKKIALLLNDIIDNPFEGIGKPEPLKFNLTGYWSRRIDKEHRLIYEVIEPDIIIVSAFGHYIT
jgi:toxin YoeB